MLQEGRINLKLSHLGLPGKCFSARIAIDRSWGHLFCRKQIS